MYCSASQYPESFGPSALSTDVMVLSSSSWVSQNFLIGGQSRHRQRLAEHIIHTGIEVSFLSFRTLAVSATLKRRQFIGSILRCQRTEISSPVMSGS